MRSYDLDGIRTSQTIGATTTSYAYDISSMPVSRSTSGSGQVPYANTDALSHYDTQGT
jgi:hypothetical protein